MFIQPPDVEYDSAEDDANENVGDVQLEDLHFNQFNQVVELDLPLLEGELHEIDDVEMAGEPSTPAAAATSRFRASKSISAPQPKTKWTYVGKHIDIPSKESCPGVSTAFKYHRIGSKLNAMLRGIFPMANYQDCAMAAHELFERFFDDELCQMIVDSTNEYSVLQNAQNPNITVDEFRVFMGILIISGYNVISDREDYWSQGTDMHNKMISTAMSRQRFRFRFRQRNSIMGKVTHLQFRWNLATYYCTKLSQKIHHEETQQRLNKSNLSRLDGLEHWVVPCARRHCAYYRCKSQTRTQYEKCNVGLCVKCFKTYHNTTN